MTSAGGVLAEAPVGRYRVERTIDPGEGTAVHLVNDQRHEREAAIPVVAQYIQSDILHG